MSGKWDGEEQQLRDRAAAAAERSEELTRRSTRLAGQIADTELEIARVHEAIAENDATSLGEKASELAAEARRFAAFERQQAQPGTGD